MQPISSSGVVRLMEPETNDEDRIEIITPISARKRRAQEEKSRWLAGFAVVSVIFYSAVLAAVALKPHSDSSGLRVGADLAKVAGRLFPTDEMNAPTWAPATP